MLEQAGIPAEITDEALKGPTQVFQCVITLATIIKMAVICYGC